MRPGRVSSKQPKNLDDLLLHPFRLWLEQYWQPSLVAEELDNGWLAVMVHQSPPLCIRQPFMFTIGAVETVGFLSSAAPRNFRKFGVGCRSH